MHNTPLQMLPHSCLYGGHHLPVSPRCPRVPRGHWDAHSPGPFCPPCPQSSLSTEVTGMLVPLVSFVLAPCPLSLSYEVMGIFVPLIPFAPPCPLIPYPMGSLRCLFPWSCLSSLPHVPLSLGPPSHEIMGILILLVPFAPLVPWFCLSPGVTGMLIPVFPLVLFAPRPLVPCSMKSWGYPFPMSPYPLVP